MVKVKEIKIEDKHHPDDSAGQTKKKAAKKAPRKVSDDAVEFFALGGLEHVGQNMYVYKHKGKYLVVDCGMGFLDGEYEGADTRYCDTSYLEKYKKDVVGIVITHGHEDHTGGLKYIWPKFGCPIYCTRFVKNFMTKVFEGAEIDFKPNTFVQFNHEGDNFQIGPFDIETFHVTHSVPEANMIIIKTEQGKILHSGDWTFNDDNPIESNTNYARLEELGRDPDLLACVCDSTEISRQPPQTTEVEVGETLESIMIKSPGRVFVTGYSRSIARLKQFADAARRAGRIPCIKERSSSKAVPYVGLPEFREIGIEYEYLRDDDLLLYKDLKDLPAEKQAIFLTGSQGEKYAMLTRLVQGQVKELKLQPTDTVVFSAIIIPGREKDVSFMYNKLAKLGIHTHTIFDTAKLHANGHAGRPEFERFYDMVHPATIIPMHGEYVAEMLNAKMGMERGGAKNMMLVKNGDIVVLRRGEQPYISETIKTGFIVIEGDTEHAGDSPVFKARKKMMLNGAVFVTMPIDKRGYLKGVPEVSSSGIFETDPHGIMRRQIQLRIQKAVNAMSKKERKSQKNIENEVDTVIFKITKDAFGSDKKPQINVHFVLK
ncbi:MAG: ribonuclease J [Rickettsiales bacterium]|jgi:ribonuclease J|nr:ribonuclease J [Rickettsiales bacterium]